MEAGYGNFKLVFIRRTLYPLRLYSGAFKQHQGAYKYAALCGDNIGACGGKYAQKARKSAAGAFGPFLLPRGQVKFPLTFFDKIWYNITVPVNSGLSGGFCFAATIE